MPSYLWPTTSSHPVLAEYRLVVPEPCACLPSICVQKFAYCSFVCHGLEAYLHSLSYFFFFFNLLYKLLFRFPTPLRSWALFDIGPNIFFGLFLDCPHFLSYYFIIPTIMTQSCWASLGQPFTLSLSGLAWPLVLLLMGSCVPFVFSLGHPRPIFFLWASLAFLLTLHSYEFLLTSSGFPSPITLFSSLGFMGLPLTPYFLCSRYFESAVAHSHFSISYTAHGYAISLFLSSFKPTCLFKAHLFISWLCDPLFLPLWPNGFAICLPTPLLPLFLGFLLSTWILKIDPQQVIVKRCVSFNNSQHFHVSLFLSRTLSS